MSIVVSSFASNNDLNKYLSFVAKIKMLTEDEEKILAIAYNTKRDQIAFKKLIVSHLPLVVKTAFSFKGYGLALSDLISEGNLGLLRAVEKFDLSKGRLSTYAIWWIKAYMTDFIINSWSLVKKGTLLARKKLFFSLGKIKKQLGISGDKIKESDAIKVAKQLNVSKQDVMEIEDLVSRRDVSINTKLGNDGSNSFDSYIQDKALNVEEVLSNKQVALAYKDAILKAFSVLNDREKYILSNRYLGEKSVSLEVIAKNFSISRERVRQIELAAMKKARKEFVKLGFDIRDYY